MYVEKHFIVAFCSFKSCPKKEIYNTQNEVVERESGHPRHFHLRCYWNWRVDGFIKGETK